VFNEAGQPVLLTGLKGPEFSLRSLRKKDSIFAAGWRRP
jgi:hypothetical protein